MTSEIRNQYAPDYVSPPGETLLGRLEELGMSQTELALRTGRPKKTISEIVHGKTAITPETALQLQRALGTPASFWNNRQQQYLEHQARMQERIYLGGEVGWLARFPVKEMISRGWIRLCEDQVEQMCELLNFFGVASPEQWTAVWGQHAVAFRRTRAFESKQEDIAAWLRRGEIEAQDIHCQPYDAQAFRSVLDEIRRLTVQPANVFQPELIQQCAGAGVALAFVPQLPKSRVSGATRWLMPEKALIQLSLRYKTDDHLWFTFFHEAGHILLHGKRDMFLEGDAVDDEKEKEADDFAARTLIPTQQLRRFLRDVPRGYYPSTQSIEEFASELGIAPGIVVGRLQHDNHVPSTHYNKLKRTLAWADEN